MKQLSISKDIISLSDFKNKASKILHNVQTSHRPLVITQNGKAAAVLVSPAEFDLLTEQAGFADAVNRGLNDVEHGRIVPDEDLGNIL